MLFIALGWSRFIVSISSATPEFSPAEKLPVSTGVPWFRFLSSSYSHESGRRSMSRISPSDINGEEFLNEFLARTLLSRNAVSPLPLLLLYSRGGPTITRPIRERTRGVRVQAEPVTTDVVGPIVPEKDSESGLGANDVGDQPLPSRTTFNLRLFRARPRMTHGVPLFLESRARFYRLLSRSRPPALFGPAG